MAEATVVGGAHGEVQTHRAARSVCHLEKQGDLRFEFLSSDNSMWIIPSVQGCHLIRRCQRDTEQCVGVFLVSHLEEGLLAAGGDPSALRRAVQPPLALGLGATTAPVGSRPCHDPLMLL